MTLTEELHAKHHILQGVVWNVHRLFCQKADSLNSKISDLLKAALLNFHSAGKIGANLPPLY